MKKVALNQWLLGLSVVAVSFGCQSKKNMESKQESDSQCEESYSEREEESDEDMSNVAPAETEEKVLMEPVHTTEAVPVEKQEEPASSPLTESAAPEQLSINSMSELEFIPEIDLEALAKMFYIDSETLSETDSVSADGEVK